MRPVLYLLSLIAPFVVGAALAVEVSHTDCTRIVRHVPAPGVTFTPGIDVNGDAVAAANVDGGIQVEPLSEIKIPITIDLQDRFGIPANSDLFEAEANVGTVTFSDGRVLFNGLPLTLGDEEAVIVACREALKNPR